MGAAAFCIIKVYAKHKTAGAERARRETGGIEMNHNRMKKAVSLTAALALCAGLLAGCQSKGPEETATEFLTAVQAEDFAKAGTYLAEDNHLTRVFAAVDGGSVPELDEVFRAYAGRMDEMTFEILGASDSDANVLNVRVQGPDYADAIQEAMNAAIQSQVAGDGAAFSDYAGWLGQGVQQAVVGDAGERDLTMGQKGGIDGIENMGFMNLLTGGFYDYTNFTMSTCTLSTEAQESVYYIAARGDVVVGCIMVESMPFDTAALTEDQLALLVTETEKKMRAKGIYGRVEVGDGELTTHIGVDFNQAEAAGLLELGLIDGSRGYMEYLSLKSTLQSFEDSGMTVETVPQYQ